MNRNLLDILLAITLITLVVVLAFVFYNMKNEGTKCTVNPLKYGVQQVEDQHNSNLSCTCNLESGNIFLLDNQGLRKFELP